MQPTSAQTYVNNRVAKLQQELEEAQCELRALGSLEQYAVGSQEYIRWGVLHNQIRRLKRRLGQL
jgi:hypothetical protein